MHGYCSVDKILAQKGDGWFPVCALVTLSHCQMVLHRAVKITLPKQRRGAPDGLEDTVAEVARKADLEFLSRLSG